MNFDCIIVLANEMDKEGNLNSESLGRINLACEVYFKNPTATLITCGWNYRKDSDLLIGNVMKSYAEKSGVPSKQILAELNSRDTVGDAFFTKLIVRQKKDWNNILVVTSDYHVNRTSNIFKFIYGNKYSIEVIGAETGSNNEKALSEAKSLNAFEETFKEINNGDDINIYNRLISKHPFYNGEIYPIIKVNL